MRYSFIASDLNLKSWGIVSAESATNKYYPESLLLPIFSCRICCSVSLVFLLLYRFHLTYEAQELSDVESIALIIYLILFVGVEDMNRVTALYIHAAVKLPTRTSRHSLGHSAIIIQGPVYLPSGKHGRRHQIYA